MLRNVARLIVARAREDKNKAARAVFTRLAERSCEMVIRVYRIARVNSVYVNSGTCGNIPLRRPGYVGAYDPRACALQTHTTSRGASRKAGYFTRPINNRPCARCLLISRRSRIIICRRGTRETYRTLRARARAVVARASFIAKTMT